MKLHLRNVYLIKKKLLAASSANVVETDFELPEKISANLYGWNVMIRSKISNEAQNRAMLVETVSQFQFSASGDLKKNFKQKKYRQQFSKLVYTAHCHHAALCITTASQYPKFGDYSHAYICMDEAEAVTLKAMRP